MEENDLKVKSLAKALRILECFSAKQPELGITQISQMMGMSKSNVHNMVSTFEQMGYIARLPGGKYGLGLKILEFSFIINQHLGYPKAVYDILDDIARQTDEIVYFGLPQGTDVLYLYVVHPRSKMSALPYRNIMGEKAPLFCTGIGKAMLAFMPEDEWPRKIPQNRVKNTENTMLEYDEILEDLRRTRHRGYSIDNAEKDVGVRCVGVPIFNTYGKLVAGVSTSGPASSMTDEKLRSCAKVLQDESLRMRERIYN